MILFILNHVQALNEVALPPYGLPSITELLRVLVNLLNPMDQQHTDSTRITSLRILNTALEVSGTTLGNYPSLSSIIFDHGCKYLFQLARSENPTVLYLSLRVISTLFDTLRPYLKLQQELFLAFTIDRLAPPESSSSSQVQLIASPRSGAGFSPYPMSPNPSFLEDGDSEFGSQTPPSRPTVAPARGETRELMLEMLSSLASPPSFMVDLWTNYDSDLHCEDIFERLIGFLTRVRGRRVKFYASTYAVTQGVYASQTVTGLDRQQQSAQLLCLDLLLAFVNHMTARADSVSYVVSLSTMCLVFD